MQINNLNTPTVQSIISRAEDHIYDMTGFSVKLVVEPILSEAGFLPILGKQVTEIWGIDEATLQSKSRVRSIATYKQVFCLLARQSHIRCTYKSISAYLRYLDHTTSIESLRVAKNFLEIKDSYFITVFEPVKHLYADFN